MRVISSYQVPAELSSAHQLSSAQLSNAAPYGTVPCRAVRCGAVLCCAVLCRAVPCCAVLCRAVPCYCAVHTISYMPRIIRTFCFLVARSVIILQQVPGSLAQFSTAALAQQRSAVHCPAVRCCAVLRALLYSLFVHAKYHSTYRMVRCLCGAVPCYGVLWRAACFAVLSISDILGSTRSITSCQLPVLLVIHPQVCWYYCRTFLDLHHQK